MDKRVFPVLLLIAAVLLPDALAQSAEGTIARSIEARGGLAALQARQFATELRVTATPSVALFGEPFSWNVAGLQPGERVTLKALSTDARGILWASEAVFQADSAGAVDVGRQAPISGGYAEADIFGLLWSMKATNSDHDQPVAYRHNWVTGWMVELTATNSIRPKRSSIPSGGRWSVPWSHHPRGIRGWAVRRIGPGLRSQRLCGFDIGLVPVSRPAPGAC
jgi:hypothetical protein